jgi:hypothetical protein
MMALEQAGDPAAALAGALADQLAPALVRFGKSASTPWASATFSGARHEVALTITGAGAIDRAHAFVARAADLDFNLGGHIVVDIDIPHYQIVGNDVDMIVECLSVEAA